MAEKPTVIAVQKALESAKKRNFTETVELAINLIDVDLSIPKNRIQEDISFQRPRKQIKVCVIGGGELALKAKDVADLVITPEMWERSQMTRNRQRRSRTRLIISSPRRH